MPWQQDTVTHSLKLVSLERGVRVGRIYVDSLRLAR